MSSSALPLLPVGEYRLEFSGLRGRWPEYAGSVWRGVFGRELRRALCVTRLPACPGCALYRSCGYPYVFETPPPPESAKQRLAPAAPHPYVLAPRPPRQEAVTELELILLGRGNEYLPQIVNALRQGARGGLGPNRARLELSAIRQRRRPGEGEWETVYFAAPPSGFAAPPSGRAALAAGAVAPPPQGRSGSEPALRAFPPRIPRTPPPPAAVRVRLETPLRAVREEAVSRPENLTFAAFFMTLLRRISLLTYFHSDAPLETDFAALAAAARGTPLLATRLQWRDWGRFSSRQNRRVPMGGVVGAFELGGADLAPFWPFLWLGQWTRAGKGAVMGLGSYTLAPAAAAAQPPGVEIASSTFAASAASGLATGDPA